MKSSTSISDTLLFLLIWTCLFNATSAISQEPEPVGPWKFDTEHLFKAPKFHDAAGIPDEGVHAIYYDGPAYRGAPTKVFAYYGLPKLDSSNPVAKVPGVVLVHGGGGTAFASWVKLWNSRGYAAIAMDLCGCVPVGTYGNWQRHPDGGPPGWDASFEQIDAPVEDQWQTHAVSAVLLGHSLLRSLPEVDAERIGLTGISWGGYMTCLVAGVDNRFRCAVPVYGCGYLGDNSVWLLSFERLGPVRAKRWLERWDPSVYLPRATMPMLWVNGTNDFAYPMDSWQRSTMLHSPSTLCLRIRMPHGHGPAGENPKEIHVFMNSILKDQAPLPTILKFQNDKTTATAQFQSSVAIQSAELCFTRDSGKWVDRRWEAVPAKLDTNQSIVTAMIPSDAAVWYLNITDDRQCVVSTEHVVVQR